MMGIEQVFFPHFFEMKGGKNDEKKVFTFRDHDYSCYRNWFATGFWTNNRDGHESAGGFCRRFIWLDFHRSDMAQ